MLNKADVAILMGSVATVVREFVSKSIEPVTDRLDDMDVAIKRTPAAADVREMVEAEVAKAIAELPPPEDQIKGFADALIAKFAEPVHA